MKPIYSLFFLFSLIVFSSKAQDLMIMRNANSDTLKVKIVLISSEKIKYQNWPVDPGMPAFEELKSRVRKVIFQNGKEIKFYEDEFSDPTNYATQNKMIIKVAPFSWLLGFTSLAFEKSISPGRSYETSLGLIGAGFNTKYLGSPTGVFLKAGYKFINRPDYHMSGMRYMHILKGSYIKPEIIGTYYGSNENSDEVSVTGLAGMLNIGKQWVYDDVFCVDVFLGLGLGNKTFKTNNNLNSNYDYAISYLPYAFIAPTNPPNGLSMCYTGGIKIGILFGK